MVLFLGRIGTERGSKAAVRHGIRYQSVEFIEGRGGFIITGFALFGYKFILLINFY